MPMRQPTPEDRKYAHWRARLAGRPVEVHENEFHAGFYEMAVGKRGPARKLIPVQVHLVAETDWMTGELVEDERFVAWSEGGAIDLVENWTYLRPISRERYDMLCDRERHIAQVSAPKAAQHGGPHFAPIGEIPVFPPTQEKLL